MRNENALESVILAAPERDESLLKRQAVVLDCEMVGLGRKQTAVAKICAIDFLTGEELVKSLVKPRQPVKDWRVQITGLSPSHMLKAAAKGRLLAGTSAARAELLRHIDKGTVLVGHSLKHDLAALQIAHAKIVDTAIVTSEAVFGEPAKKFPRLWGLQALCKELLRLKIRRGSEAKQGARAHAHDTLEDVLAAREMVLQCLRHPSELDAWALKAREDMRCGPNRSSGF
ncbi:hypothetical protein DL764_005942 [Monosporascus ibericus]|uniref:Exonuclease domain-containing protein n=1 Tax=Monosporascus ibericus TaxID=155417 RepID=A0A4Q4TAA6_9PEZI|nr:hypothetical protein DL764_005942 [Monosporascus ibericus]